VCQQVRDAVGEHGGGDVRVVNLPAADHDGGEEGEQLGHHVRAVFGYPEPGQESGRVPNEGYDRHERSHRPGVGHGGQVFPHDLPADPQLVPGDRQVVESGGGHGL
jgi:hypothetical protein